MASPVAIGKSIAKPPGHEDAGMFAELSAVFPEIDRAVQTDLNAIAVAVKNWRKEQLGTNHNLH